MKDQREKYLEDIRTIKNLLVQIEERSLIEPWAFYVWSVMVLIGTVLHITAHSMTPWNPGQYLIYIWLPVLIISSFAEIFSWIKKAGKDSRPVLTRLIVKFVFSVVGIITVISFLFFLLIRSGLFSVLPGMTLALTSMIFILYGILSYRFIIFSGYLMLLFGILFVLLPLPSYWNILLPSLTGCLICAFDGMMIQKIESGHGK